MQHILLTETILYVANQQASTDFYENLFRQKADLNVPGMTEFRLSDTCKLGLMPNDGIAKILKDKTPHPQTGQGIPRCELYFYVADVATEYANAITLGAKEISGIENRDWGDKVCYFADLDGHVIAFAERF
jgi:uncharacterized glyoxalase superfamily protein PhnB